MPPPLPPPPPPTTVTESADYSSYQNGTGWWALQNPWGKAKLVNGTDYTQSVTVRPTTFPDGTVLNWSWPVSSNTSHVYGYPELIYGAEGGTLLSPDRSGPTPVQIDTLSALTGSFNLTLGGDPSHYDVLWETQLTSAPDSGQVDEIGILLHSPTYFSQYVAGWATHYSYNENGLRADIAVGTNGAYPYVLVMPTQGDMLSGTVDLKSILSFLTQRGVLTGKEYIDGWEMGAEPTSGSGSLTINSIGYDWNGTNVGTGSAFRSTTRPGRQLRSMPTQRQSR